MRVAQLIRDALLLMQSEKPRRAADTVAASEKLGKWNLRDVLLDTAADIKVRINELKEPTTVPGIITQGYCLDLVFQFDKRGFARLSETLDAPQHFIVLPIFFPSVDPSATPRPSSVSPRLVHCMPFILLDYKTIDW